MTERSEGTGMPRPPSWRTATSESEAALRQVTQAQRSLDRAVSELRLLRAWGDRMARLELAKRLAEGDDGGVLHLIVSAAEAPASQVLSRAILERLQGALGLSAVGQRGELLRLTVEQVAEFDVRGEVAPVSAVYRVVRPGWLVDGEVVRRPVLELAREGDDA
jgi:hypothetical protein